MPEKETLQRAKEDLREGKSPTTAAGEFVHEEIEHVREGKHGARSTKQAIAIGLSKARRAGIPLKPPAAGQTSEKTRRAAQRAYEAGSHKGGAKKASRKRQVSSHRALERESTSTVSRKALSKQAKSAARRRRTRARSAK